METRWKEGKPRAYYPKLEDQESPMEIWIGDAVNMCTRCKGVLVFEKGYLSSKRYNNYNKSKS